MRKLVAAINMTLDGIADHTAVDPDEEIHQYYTELLKGSGAILYGRVTYELMTFWRPFVKTPSGEKTMDDFAIAIDSIPKIVFSRTLTEVDWETAKLADLPVREQVSALKQQDGNDILVGSRSLILQLLQLHLIDELQLCIHPVIAGSGLRLFDNLHDTNELRLLRSKTFRSGAVVLCYEPAKDK